MKKITKLLLIFSLICFTLSKVCANTYYVLTLDNRLLCSGCKLPGFGNYYGYSLSDAINDANANPGLDIISFEKLLLGSGNLSTEFIGKVNGPAIAGAVAAATSYSVGASSYTISIDNSGYPAITDPVLIDAEFGFSGVVCGGGSPKIIISNSSGSGGTPFRLNAGSTGSTIRGLSISNFATGIACNGSNNHTIINNAIFLNSGNGILLNDASGCLIVGNRIGIRPNGTAGGNGEFGVLFDPNCSTCNNNTIGGSSLCDRNYISNNGTAGNPLYMSGISIQGTALGKIMNAIIRNNYLGTDVSGTVDMGNKENGLVATFCDGCTIQDNVVSGNDDHGIIIQFNQNGGVVRNNIIGSDPSGTMSIGNTNFGIDAEGGTNFSIQNNQVINNGKSGIYFQNTSTIVNVYSNIINNNNTSNIAANAGIYITGGSTRIQIGNTATEENTISNNKKAGIQITGATSIQNPIRQNKIFCNEAVGRGIVLLSGGNGAYAAPVLAGLVGTTVSGTAPANSIVELFYDNSCAFCQGKTFVVSTTATAGGTFSVTNAAFTTTVNLSATATQSGGGNNRNTSPFSNCLSVLPVELISFDATLLPDLKVFISWITTSEKNNAYFEIQKTNDFSSWSAIAKVEGVGNSNTINRYSIIDPSPNIGTTYYRIVQTDFDGRKSISQYVQITLESDLSVYLFGNPIHEDSQVGIICSNNENISLAMIDIQGRLLFEDYYISNGSMHLVDIKVKDLVNGLYFLKVINGKKIIINKIIIRK